MDQYELMMAASYLHRAMNEPAVFELFARHLPPHRDWLLVAGVGPGARPGRADALRSARAEYLRGLGFPGPSSLPRGLPVLGSVDAMHEGTVAFAGEPLLRVTAPRIEAQLVETLLLNQVNFQTAIATKAARLVLAAGAGSRRWRLVDFSPRRDTGRRGDEGGALGRDRGGRGDVEPRRGHALRADARGDDGALLRAVFPRRADAFRRSWGRPRTRSCSWTRSRHSPACATRSRPRARRACH